MSEVITTSEAVELKTEKLVFDAFPGYARFLRDNHFVPYIQEQIRISREINLPILRFFEGVPDEELITMGIGRNSEFLTAVYENRLQAYLQQSLQKWYSDTLGIVRRDEITAEDITLTGYMRKTALLKFLPLYTTNIGEALDIVREIDAFTTVGDTAATNLYIRLQKERLAESEKKLLKSNEIAHVGNWTWDLETGTIEWSDELYRIYGIDKSFELTFENIMAFNRPEDNLTIRANLKRCKELLEPSEATYHITLKDGTQKIMHARTEIMGNAAGNATKMIGIIQDVTEKQALIERLQYSDRLYKQAEAISHIGNWHWDLATRRLEWSDELYKIYEVEAIELSTGLRQYNHPDDDKTVQDKIAHAIRTLEPFDFVYRIVLPDGRVKTLNAKGEVVTDAQGAPTSIYGIVQDITQQKLVEKLLEEYQQFIRKITDVTPSVIAAYNIHTGKYSFINKAVEKLLGYPASRAMEEGTAFFSSLIHPDDLQVVSARNSKAIDDANNLPPGAPEPIAEFKYRMLHANGGYVWLHTYSTVFERNEKGKVESILNVSVDMTSQEKAEQALYVKNLELQQSNTSLEEYAYVASHDLKEPLRKISTFSDRLLISQSELLGEDGKDYLNRIILSANRMQKIINDLLSVSTILGNNSFEPCDLNAVIEEAIQVLDHKIEETDAVIEYGGLPTISVVPSQFRQLFQNLIGNSLKFVRKDVRPRIIITHSFLKPAETDGLSLRKARKYLKLEIEDNGIGFDNQFTSKIFFIFQRLHGKSEYEGTGIGLALCKKIIENHGGMIYAEGVAGKGAKFSIILPL